MDFNEDPLDLFDDDGVNEMCLLFDEKENKKQNGQHLLEIVIVVLFSWGQVHHYYWPVGV